MKAVRLGTAMPIARPPRFYYRRKLPHFQKDSKLTFITMSTHQRLILPPHARDIVLEHVVYEDANRIALHCAVVMPDHVHMLFTILEKEDVYYPLAAIMHGIRGASAHRINKLLHRSGAVWQEEFFDRILRYGEADSTVEYMFDNPVKAGLIKDGEDYPWLWVSKFV